MVSYQALDAKMRVAYDSPMGLWIEPILNMATVSRQYGEANIQSSELNGIGGSH